MNQNGAPNRIQNGSPNGIQNGAPNGNQNGAPNGNQNGPPRNVVVVPAVVIQIEGLPIRPPIPAEYYPPPVDVRIEVEQLRREAPIERKKVSECVNDLIAYCEDNRPADFLVAGPSAAADPNKNPFVDQKRCGIL